jgi:hypothetical protein
MSKILGPLTTSLHGDQGLLQATTLKTAMLQNFIKVPYQISHHRRRRLNGNLLNNPPT